MKVILYTQDNGSTAVVYPHSSWQGTLDELAAKDVPSGKVYSIVEEVSLPDEYFFDAWEHDEVNKQVNVDMGKARIVQMDIIRKRRDEILAELDVETLKGVDVQAQKQALRDIPQTYDLTTATTLAELKQMMPEELKA